MLVSSAVVLGTISIASLTRTSSLAAGGGGAVAEQLGGTRVTGDTTDPLRRRLLNVVEEMAIASGVPVPRVYVLEREAAINAFAAGHNPANAAIAVTRGALTNLNRDELQGVIAHEFSHVLNGDMRLSTRLIGWLFGLTVVATVARVILRHLPRASGNRKGGGAIAVVAAAAFIILILGWIGLFFGRLIQAAVSRKRESLADASAIQFTRDPQGLRGALVKIGALGAGSRFVDADAEEVAHLLFASGIARAFETHPPLVERIREIDPRFQEEEFEAMRHKMNAERAASEEEAARQQPKAAERLGGLLEGAVVLSPAVVAGLVANPGTADVTQAAQMLASLPPEFRRLAMQPEKAARALHRARARPFAGGAGAPARLRVRAGGRRFPRRDEGSAGLRRCAHRRAAHARAAPGVLRAAPARAGGANRAAEAAERAPDPRRARVAVRVCAAQARAGAAAGRHRSESPHRRLPDAAGPRAPSCRCCSRRSPRTAARTRPKPAAPTRPACPTCCRARGRTFTRLGHWAPQLDHALSRLDSLQPAAKEMLVKALVRTVSHDLRMTVAESELLRAICAVLHCPLPALYKVSG